MTEHAWRALQARALDLAPWLLLERLRRWCSWHLLSRDEREKRTRVADHLVRLADGRRLELGPPAWLRNYARRKA